MQEEWFVVIALGMIVVVFMPFAIADMIKADQFSTDFTNNDLLV